MKKNKRAMYQKNPGRSTDQVLHPLGIKEDLTAEETKDKKTTKIEEIKEENYDTVKSGVSFQLPESPEDKKVTSEGNNVADVPPKEGKAEENKTTALRMSKDTSVQEKRKRLMEIKKKKRASVRWQQPTNHFALDDLSLGGAKMISQSKISRLRSAIPENELQLEDTNSDISDPEIRRLKRKAGVWCKFMIEWLFIIGIFAASTINFNFLSLMYFLGGLLLFSERMSLSIKGGNPRQDALINMFMFWIPMSLIFKTISLVIIYSNLSKLQALMNVKEFIEKDIIFETFQHIAKYIGVVQNSDVIIINILLTVTPEIFIGVFIIALNYISSDKIGEEYMNKQDVLQEKSLAFGSSTFAVLLMASIEFLAVINVSWIGFIFQLFVLITVLSFSWKKSNILFVVDLISLISIFLAVGQLILLFLYEIPLIPLHQLQFIFHFIGVDQDRSQVLAIIHAGGAIAVFVFGIVYLRSRRLFIIQSMYEHQYEWSDGEDGVPNLDSKIKRKASNNQNGQSLSPIHETENESSNEDEDDDEPEENDYLIWRIYDKIFAAFTSEFVVSNLWRLGLWFWILRYNCLQSVVIVIFLFHSTLIKSYINFLPFIQLIYLPYMILNLVCFYVINLVFKIPAGESHSLSGVKYGIIVFENPYIEFPIMLFWILLSSLFAIKISNFSVMLQGLDESSFQKKKTMKTLRNIQKQSAFLSMLYYIFYLSIEALLLFILLVNVISKVNLTNFCLNLYLVVYLIYPDIARRHIQKFLFIIEALNLVNYVYGIVIASSEMTFSVGEIGNLIGIDWYDVYIRKYFNVIPTIRIIALIIVTMTIWNTLPGDADEEYQSDKNNFEAKIYKTLYGFSKWFTEFLYIWINIIRNLVIWIWYILIFVILIQNDHSIKNWILAILIIFTIYKHCNNSEYYMKYLATYAGFVFISTWVYQFFKFDIIKKVFGVTNVEHIPFNGEFWGYTVLTEEQLLFRVVALSALLVISVIGSRSVESKDKILPTFSDSAMQQEIKLIDEELLYN